MKSNRWIVAIVLATACASFAQQTEPPPAEAVPPPPRFDRDNAREEFHRQKVAIKKRVNEALIAANAEFKVLFEKEDKTKEDKQRMRQLKREFIKSEAVRAIKQEHKEFVRAFEAKHGRDRGDKPASAEDRENVDTHHETVRAKHNQLNELLVASSERYAELVDQENKNPEEFREMMRLRRELISDSEQAQTILDDIRETNEGFHKDNPKFRKRRGRDRGREVRRNQAHVNLMKGMHHAIDETLAEENPEYEALLNKPEPTAEDLQAIAKKRLQLLGNSRDGKALQAGLEVLKRRLEKNGIDVEKLMKKKQQHRHQRLRRAPDGKDQDRGEL